KIAGSVQRMEALIEDILVLTKIHSDTHSGDEVDLREIAAKVMDDMSGEIEERNVVIKTEGLPVIKGNSNQVFYLFKNLISNAIKFQKPGNLPQLTITATVVKGSELQWSEEGKDYLQISFADNGF